MHRSHPLSILVMATFWRNFNQAHKRQTVLYTSSKFCNTLNHFIQWLKYFVFLCNWSSSNYITQILWSLLPSSPPISQVVTLQWYFPLRYGITFFRKYLFRAKFCFYKNDIWSTTYWYKNLPSVPFLFLLQAFKI